jgi:hypothetical protein
VCEGRSATVCECVSATVCEGRSAAVCECVSATVAATVAPRYTGVTRPRAVPRHDETGLRAARGIRRLGVVRRDWALPSHTLSHSAVPRRDETGLRVTMGANRCVCVHCPLTRPQPSATVRYRAVPMMFAHHGHSS